MKRQKKIRQQGLSRRYCQNTRKGSLKPQNMISDIKMSIGKMEKEMVTTKKKYKPIQCSERSNRYRKKKFQRHGIYNQETEHAENRFPWRRHSNEQRRNN